MRPSGGQSQDPIRIWLRIVVTAGLALNVWGCSSNKSGPPAQLVKVEAVAVRRMNLQQQSTTEAVVFAIHEATIVPKISAPILKFYVNRGDHVRAGELVAVLDNGDLKAAVAEANGAYEQAQANFQNATGAQLPVQVQAAEQDVQNARSAFQAAQYLYESDNSLYKQGALAKARVDEAQVALVQAQNKLAMAEQQLQRLQAVGKTAQVKAAQGQLDAARGQYEAAKAQLAYSEIRSPMTGVVTDRPLYPGGMASAGSPLMTIMDTSRIIARAHLPVAQAEGLKAGDVVEVSAPGQEHPSAGKVTLVSPALDPDSTTVEVWAEAANPMGRLKPGITVTLTFTSKNIPGALTVPTSAVVSKPDQPPYVMIVGSDGRAHERVVQIGIEQGNNKQILQGLREGELVVTTGAYGLPDNVKVQVGKTSATIPRPHSTQPFLASPLAF